MFNVFESYVDALEEDLLPAEELCLCVPLDDGVGHGRGERVAVLVRLDHLRLEERVGSVRQLQRE